MSKAGFAPAGSINGVRLIVAALMAVGVLAVGLLGPALARADGSVTNCSAAVVCVGQVNGIPVTVNIGDVGNANLNVLTNSLNDAFVSVANISDVNILSVDLNTAVQTVVNSVVTTTTKTCSAVVAPPATATTPGSITITCA